MTILELQTELAAAYGPSGLEGGVAEIIKKVQFFVRISYRVVDSGFGSIKNTYFPVRIFIKYRFRRVPFL